MSATKEAMESFSQGDCKSVHRLNGFDSDLVLLESEHSITLFQSYDNDNVQSVFICEKEDIAFLIKLLQEKLNSLESEK